MATMRQQLDQLIAEAELAEREARAEEEATRRREMQAQINRAIDLHRDQVEGTFAEAVIAAAITGYGFGALKRYERDDQRAYAVISVDDAHLWLFWDHQMHWGLLDPHNRSVHWLRDQHSDSDDRALLLSIAAWRGTSTAEGRAGRVYQES